jgi:hypothetical protein
VDHPTGLPLLPRPQGARALLRIRIRSPHGFFLSTPLSSSCACLLPGPVACFTRRLTATLPPPPPPSPSP